MSCPPNYAVGRKPRKVRVMLKCVVLDPVSGKGVRYQIITETKGGGWYHIRFTRRDGKSLVKSVRGQANLMSRFVTFFSQSGVAILEAKDRLPATMTATLAEAISKGVDPHTFVAAMENPTITEVAQVAMASKAIQSNYIREHAVNQKWGDNMPELDQRILSALGI